MPISPARQRRILEGETDLEMVAGDEFVVRQRGRVQQRALVEL
jgi:hypothetical protein